MWRFYLSVCAACFRVGALDVWQVLLSPIRERRGALRAPRIQRPVKVEREAVMGMIGHGPR
jgi:hypothetical protein